MFGMFKIFGRSAKTSVEPPPSPKGPPPPTYPQAETKGISGHDIPLHKAVYMSNRKMLREALERGDDINQIDKLGKTALHYAARDGDLDVLTALFSAGADPNIRDFGGQGSTAKEIAIESGHHGIYENALMRSHNRPAAAGFAWLTVVHKQ